MGLVSLLFFVALLYLVLTYPGTSLVALLLVMATLLPRNLLQSFCSYYTGCQLNEGGADVAEPGVRDGAEVVTFAANASTDEKEARSEAVADAADEVKVRRRSCGVDLVFSQASKLKTLVTDEQPNSESF